MALQLTVDSIDSLPESIRPLYAQDGDKFRLQLDGYEDPAGLKSALQKEREAAKTATRQANAWASLGKTPEEVQALVETQRKAEEDKLTSAGEWVKLKAQMNEQQAREKADLTEKLTAKDKALERYLIDAQATAAIAELKGSARILLPHVKAAVKVVEEDGSFVIRVVDDKGNPRVNGKGEFLTIKDLVSEMRQSDDFGRAFDATGTTGGGAPPGSNGPTGKKSLPQAQIDAMPPKARSAFFTAGGVAT